MRTKFTHERIFFSLAIVIVTTYVLLVYSGQRNVALVEENMQEILSDEDLVRSDKLQEISQDLEDITDKKDSEEDKMKKLPGFLIAGVKKCGTGALLEILKMHPNIAGPSYDKSEVHFWDKEYLYQKGVEYYKDLMPDAEPDQTVIVKAPGVLRNPAALKRIFEAIPDVKMLLVVRNPIDRVVSDIIHEYAVGSQKDEEMPDINNIIVSLAQQNDKPGDLLGHVFNLTNYHLLYDNLASVFPKENILVVNGDKLIEDPQPEIERVEYFLNLPSFFNEVSFYYPDGSQFPCFKHGEKQTCMRGDKGREHPTLKKGTLDLLENIFQPMVDKLEEQTGVCLHGFRDKFGE